MTMVMIGPVFIAKGAQDRPTMPSSTTPPRKGLHHVRPARGQSNPSQTKGMTNLYKAIAETGGIPITWK